VGVVDQWRGKCGKQGNKVWKRLVKDWKKHSVAAAAGRRCRRRAHMMQNAVEKGEEGVGRC